MKESMIQLLETIKCLAIFRGLQLCILLGINKLIIESGCQIIVQELQQGGASMSFLGNIIQDIRSLMPHFQFCEMQFRYRYCNTMSHSLAHFACNIAHIAIWKDSFPNFLSQPVWQDKKYCNPSLD